MYFSYGKQEDGTKYLEIVNLADISKLELSFKESLSRYEFPQCDYVMEIQFDNRITIVFCSSDRENFLIKYEDRFFCVNCKQLTDFISAKNV